DLVDLEVIGAIGHVEVVRLGGAERQHCYLPVTSAEVAVVLFGEDPFAHWGLQNAFSREAKASAIAHLRLAGRRSSVENQSLRLLVALSAGSLPSTHGPSSFW